MNKQSLKLTSVVILAAMLLSACSGAIPAVSEKAAAVLDAQLEKVLPAESRRPLDFGLVANIRVIRG